MKVFNNTLKVSASIIALTAGASLFGATAQALTITGTQDGVSITTDVVGNVIVDSAAIVTDSGIYIDADVSGDLVNNGSVTSIFELEDGVTLGGAIISYETIGGDFVNTGSLTSVTGSSSSDTQDVDMVGSDPAFSFITAGTSSHGALLYTVTGSATNAGDIDAESDASVASDITITSDATGNAIASAEAGSATQGLSGTFGEGLTNTIDGTISAESTSSGDLQASATGADADVTGDVSAYAEAIGIAVMIDGALNNVGGVAATASATLTGDISAAASAGYASGLLDLEGSASAAGIEAYGASDFANSGTVSANATFSATGGADISATGTDASLTASSLDMGAAADGVILYSELDSFSNSGTITASAAVATATTSTVSATGDASIDAYGIDIDAEAGGVVLKSEVGSFTNVGTITAQAKADVLQDATLEGGFTATASVGTSASATATGLYASVVDGAASNTGTISATANGTLGVAVNVTSEDATAVADAYSDLGVIAVGAYVSELQGSFVNGDKAVLSAAATSAGNTALAASGVAAVATLDGLSNTVTATGLYVAGGEHSLKNTGTISGIATLTQVIDADATANDGAADVFLASVLATVYGSGIYDTGIVKGFDNAGTISGTANLSLTETLSAIGSDGSAVNALNEVLASAGGVAFDEPMLGNFVNSGTITSAASVKLDLNVVSGTGDEPGEVEVINVVGVTSIGVAADFALPPVEEDEDEQENVAAPVPFTFTNSGKIIATADLTINASVPLGTTEDPSYGNAGLLQAYGAQIGGAAGTITNSGTISATGTVNVTGGGDNLIVADVVGLSLTDIGAGGTVVNSGTITATLSGQGATTSAAIGVLIGPFEGEMSVGNIFAAVEASETSETTETSETGSTTGSGLPTNTLIYTTAASDVTTLTNTGTISATNSMGPAYGIGALYATSPLVINQQGGSISAEIAIEINQGNGDTLNWTGGEIHGVVSADEFDVVNVFAGTGTPANKTITATEDFVLVGGAALNIGVKDAPVTFAFNGLADTGVVNLNDDATLVVGPIGEIYAATFNMAPEATLEFDFLPSKAGFIGVYGDANIDGKLVAKALPGLYGDKGAHVVLETKGEVVGTFDNVSIVGDTLLLDFSATLGEQELTISWERTAFDEVPGLTVNATSVAGALEEGYDPTRTPSKNDPELNDILSGLFTLADGALYDRVLNSWSGSEHAQVMRAAANLSEPYHMALSEHLNDIRRSGAQDGQVVMLRPKGSSNAIAPMSAAGASGPEESGFSFWGRAFGRWADTRGDIEADGYEEDTLGAVLGADFQLSPNVVLGIVGGYTDDSLDFDDGDEAEIKRWTIGGYVSATIDRFYIDASISYASDNYKTRRTILFGDTSCLAFNCTSTASAKYDGDGWLGHAEVGYVFDIGNGTSLQPFAGLNYSSVSLDPFSETGGGDLGLDVLEGKGRSLQSRLGARLTGEWGSGSVKWIPELRAEWRHEFKDDPAFIAANLNGLPNNPFVAIGSEVTGDLAVVGVGVTALVSSSVGVFFDYQAAFGSGYSSHIVQGGVRVKF